jgi:hypothetical protein
MELGPGGKALRMHEGHCWRIVVADHEPRTPLTEDGQLQGTHSPSPAVGGYTRRE